MDDNGSFELFPKGIAGTVARRLYSIVDHRQHGCRRQGWRFSGFPRFPGSLPRILPWATRVRWMVLISGLLHSYGPATSRILIIEWGRSRLRALFTERVGPLRSPSRSPILTRAASHDGKDLVRSPAQKRAAAQWRCAMCGHNGGDGRFEKLGLESLRFFDERLRTGDCSSSTSTRDPPRF